MRLGREVKSSRARVPLRLELAKFRCVMLPWMLQRMPSHLHGFEKYHEASESDWSKLDFHCRRACVSVLVSQNVSEKKRKSIERRS